ncbi:MAG: nicotinamide mononucleotide transporter [Clostridia bacterium]|nr:nicotinamide mononucleotide transporter [Clostridia bacterium]
MKRLLNYFTKFELILWLSSIAMVVISYVGFGRSIDLAFFASIIGATSLIFNAKGNPIGPALMMVFCVIYGYISYTFSYYGEMITYLGMSWPMAVLSVLSWLKNPYKGKKSQVTINNIGKIEIFFVFIGAAVATVLLYFLLKYFNTNNLLISTFSVTTSFIAAYFTMRRSPYFALAYAVNDIVLIVMWIMATFSDIYYLSVVICFAMFLVNDSYSFINWRRMQKKQKANL